MKTTTATKMFRKALTDGRLVIHPHAAEMARNAGLSDAFIEAEIDLAAEGDLDANRNHPGRFIAYGRATIMSVEIDPQVMIVTIMIIE